MRYTVVWSAQAERDLAQVWLEAEQRDSITRAASEIEAKLSNNAANVGESREPDQRIVIAEPLGAVFEVLREDRIARVLFLWRYETHR